MMKIKIITFAILMFSVSLATYAQAEKAQVLAQSKKVLTALKAKDMRTLANYVHPAKGVRFSPYGYIHTDKEDLVFKKSQIQSLFLTRRIYDWGAEDGTGDQLKLGFPAYYARFIYDKDFARAPRVTFNQVAKQGNTIVNIGEAYPKAKFVEYHFAGTRKNDRMDWSSLRLIFEKSGKTWFLVGISHDQWTI